MYCIYCGEWIEDGSRVCRFCGKEQEGSGGFMFDQRGIAAKNTYIGDHNRVGGNIIIGEHTTVDCKSTNVDNRGGFIQRSTIGGSEERLRICPYCGKGLNFSKPPRFCHYCKEQMME